MKLRTVIQWRSLSTLNILDVIGDLQPAVIDNGERRLIELDSHHWMGGSKGREMIIWVADVNAADCVLPIRDIRKALATFLAAHPEASLRHDVNGNARWRVMFADEYDGLVEQLWWTMCEFTGVT